MSVHDEISPPRICSGAMYLGEPMKRPACVRSSASPETSFTRPKSSTLTLSRSSPRSLRRMLPGLRSRWTTPKPCASRSERQTCEATCARRAERAADLRGDVRDAQLDERPLVAEHAVEGAPLHELHRDEVELVALL